MPSDAGEAGAPLSLKDRFSHGLDAPICLTWELTYACNLACVHCLSSSGRRDPAELTPAEAVGSSTSWSGCRCSTSTSAAGSRCCGPTSSTSSATPWTQRVGVKFSTNGTRLTRGAGEAIGGAGLFGRAGEYRRGHGGDERRRPGRGFVRRGPGGDGQPGGGRLRPVQGQRRRHPRRTSKSSTRWRRWRTRYGAQLRLTRLRPSGRGVDSWDDAAPDRRAAAPALPLVARAARRADGRLLLPPVRSRRAARRPQPVRGGAGGVPHRPRRRRLRLPVRHRPPVPGGQRAGPGWFRGGVARVGAVHVAARAPERRRLCVVRFVTTRAGAGAWRRSSSPGCPWTGPTPSACTAMAKPRWRAWRRRRRAAVGHRPLEGGPGRHAGPGAATGAGAVPHGRPHLNRSTAQLRLPG